MSQNLEDTTTLARYFAALIREALSPYELAAVVLRNARPEYSRCCATHDFIDPNACMYGAFCALRFAPPDVASEADAALMNAAWTLARSANFAPIRIATKEA